MLLLRKELRRRAAQRPKPLPLMKAPGGTGTAGKKKTILLVKRDGGQRPTGLTLDFSQVLHTLRIFLQVTGLEGEWKLEVFSDADKPLIECVACTARLFARANLLIAKHGAALSNMLFMPEGTTVFEQWDYGL